MDGRDSALHQSEQLFTCPSDTGERRIYQHQVNQANNQNYGTYSINGAYECRAAGNGSCPDAPSGPANSYWHTTQVTLSNVEAAATTLWVSESNTNLYNQFYRIGHWNGLGLSVNTSDNPRTIAGAYEASSFPERRLGTINALYIDGHVKAQKLDAILKVNNGVYSMLSIQDD